MTLSFSSLSGGTSFTIITSTGGSKTATLSKTFPAGTYLIESMGDDTNLEVYLGTSDNTQVGSCVAGAKSITASGSFLYVTTVNADTNDAVIFTLKSAATLATKTDAVWAPPTITDITPSGLPNIDDTTTITGTNFASNVEVKFRKSDDSTLVTPKTTVRGSATSIIAGRPDSFAVGDAPYDVIVTNPTTTLSASSLNAITSGAVPVWVTSSTLNEATLTQAFSQTISATDADGSSTITYAIVSGSLPTGLSLNTSTGAITGTPTGSTGSYTVTISATDSGANAVNRTFTQALVSLDITADFLVIAGGGSGGRGGSGQAGAGGGGAGGYRCSVTGELSGRNSSPMSKLTLTSGTTYTVTVGGGAPAQTSNSNGTQGSPSSIAGSGITTVSCTGGGFGSKESSGAGGAGGSGGGSTDNSGGGAGTVGEGFAGNNRGNYPGNNSGGGGGAGGGNQQSVADGGVGIASSITGSSVYRAGGGGGGSYQGYPGGSGGNGGGGAGAVSNGTNGTANTGGGGGGGGSSSSSSGGGGSGIVILNVNSPAASTTGSPTYNNPSSGVHIYQFLNGGTITF